MFFTHAFDSLLLFLYVGGVFMYILMRSWIIIFIYLHVDGQNEK